MDSTFVLGSVTPGAQLTINGMVVPVYRTGGFLAWLPIDTGLFVFRVQASHAEGRSSLDWPVLVDRPAWFVPDSVLTILSPTIEPSNRQVLMAGDILEVSLRGTPDCVGHFCIEGVEETFPMVEYPAGARSPNEDDADFRSVGLYTGVWQAPAGLKLDSAHVQLCLSRDTVLADTLMPSGRDSTFCRYTACVRAVSPGVISVNTGEVPQIAELTDSVQTLRFGPRLGYLTIFQPAGVLAVYAGESGDWVRLRLAPGYAAWVEKNKTKFLPLGTPVPGGTISMIRTQARSGWTDVTLNLSSRLPFKVTEDPENLTLHVMVFGATTNTDWVRYDSRDNFIRRVDWDQTDPGVYTLTVHLASGPLWGYEAAYHGGHLVLSLRHPPDFKRGLRGLTICLDPGHSPDPGAVGPTGLAEKDANLAIALALRRELSAKGARVIMTRASDTGVDLQSRPAIARAADADLYLSIHNNAVPDGVNPYADNGSGSYYYHPHSHQLAKAIHRRLVEATGLPDYGLYHANFAVLRPTQYPSVLVECAFLILPEHEEKLRNPEFDERIAKGIVRGVSDFLAAPRK